MPSETAYGARCHDHALWPDCRFKLTSHKVTDFRGVDPPVGERGPTGGESDHN